jgi:hypothetical protein
MNESLLRWKARIGSLKGAAVIVIIFLVIFLFPVIEGLTTAWKNPGESLPVTVSQLALGQVEESRYVNVSGLAAYDLAYTETENDATKAIIYPLIDRQNGVIVFVRTTHTELQNASDATVTVSGMTTRSATELKNIIEKDKADINNAGFQVSSTLYIEDGKKPGQVVLYLLALAAMGFAGLLCLVTFFFPVTVFNPYPIQSIRPGDIVSKAVKATGNFQQVKKMEPLEFAKSMRKFQDSNANLFFMNDKTLGVYIHFIFTYRVHGIPVSKKETDWMVLVRPTNIIAIEPGKLYGWKDRWAISIRFKLPSANKEQTLLLSFDNGASQVNFINALREMGYAVSSGQYTVTGPAWA